MADVNIRYRMPPAENLSYVQWLMTIVHVATHPEEAPLLSYLNAIPLLFPQVGNPDIWEQDCNWYNWCDWMRGLYMRLGGQEHLMPGQDDPSQPYTVLEWLVTMAVRVEDDLMHDPYNYPDDRSWCWFWVMIHNLGLDAPNIGPVEVENAIQILLTRSFSVTGAGSICGYIPGNSKDMRYLTFWAQMNRWSVQNYNWEV